MMKDKGFFKSVKALPNYQLEVEMCTNANIVFDFKPRLVTARFGSLRDETIFKSVYTDGNYLIFEKDKYKSIRITAKEFMDMVMIDRTNEI